MGKMKPLVYYGEIVALVSLHFRPQINKNWNSDG